MNTVEKIVEDIKYNHLEEILIHAELSVHALDEKQHNDEQRKRIEAMFEKISEALTKAIEEAEERGGERERERILNHYANYNLDDEISIDELANVVNNEASNPTKT